MHALFSKLPPSDAPARSDVTRALLASPQATCVWHDGVDAPLVNDAFDAMFGPQGALSPALPIGGAWPEAWQALHERVATALGTGAAFQDEAITLYVPEGEREVHLRAHGAAIEAAGVPGVSCTFVDMTAEVSARRELEALRRLLLPDSAPVQENPSELSRTQDALAHQVESLKLLHELAMRLGGISEPGPALQAVLEAAVNAQGAAMGLVWLHEPATGFLATHMSFGFDAETLLAFDRVVPGPGGGGAGNAFARGTRYVIEDVLQEAAFAPYREAALRAGIRALHCTPIVTRNGDLLGVISVHFRAPHRPDQRDMQIADVCARHAADAIEAGRAVEATRRSDRIFRAMGESIDYGVWTCDREGRNTYASDSFLRLTGLTRESCSGHGWGAALHPDERKAIFAAWSRCVREGGEWDVEQRILGVDGRYHAILARGVPVRDERGHIECWAGINFDIGRLKQVENELRELDKRKNEFLATLAHELRNPLAPLRNGLEVIRLSTAGTGPLDKARAMMERQLAQMVRLVDDLLDVSRVSRGKIELRREEVDLATALAHAIETSQPLMADRRHRFRAVLPPEPIRVDGDPTRLAQVFANLLNNAAKYTEPGGEVELAVRFEGGAAVVTVRDNGVGIPADMISQVFDIFTQVDRSLEKTQGGLGIGLSIAKRLVEMHGGTITVESRGKRHGSEFTVRLPARAAAATEAPGAATGASVVPTPVSLRRRVLVADDNEDSAVTLSMMLEVIGNDVRVARDGQEAVEMAADYQPDVVLLDIGMPRMNGYDACRAIRSQAWASGAYLVALTGWGQEDDKNRALEAGFDRHLVKPVEPRLIETLVSSLPARPRRGA